MNIPPDYVAGRRALLDTLEILAPHRDALILVGAQAVYLHAAITPPRTLVAGRRPEASTWT